MASRAGGCLNELHSVKVPSLMLSVSAARALRRVQHSRYGTSRSYSSHSG